MGTITNLHAARPIDDVDARAAQLFALARTHLEDLPPLQRLEDAIGALEQASGGLLYLADSQPPNDTQLNLGWLATQTIMAAGTAAPRDADLIQDGVERARRMLEGFDVDDAFDAIAGALQEATAALMFLMDLADADSRQWQSSLACEIATVASDTTYAAASRPLAVAA